MPLLCVRCLLALLLLPLALSCDQQKPRTVIASSEILKQDLDGAKTSINASLHNRTCPKPRRRQQDCTSNNVDEVHVLLEQACKMETFGFAATERLTDTLIYLIDCTCEDLPTRAPRSRRRKRTTTPAARTRRLSPELRSLCKVKVILAAMTECLEMLR